MSDRDRAGSQAGAIRANPADETTREDHVNAGFERLFGGAEPEHRHLGYRAGAEWFRDYFRRLDELGLDHVVVGLRGDDPEAAMETFADEVRGRL